MVIAALFLGFLGSLHCVGMCGPIVLLLPIGGKKKFTQLSMVISYHLGRLATYTMLGVLFGFIGSRIQLFGFQQQLSILLGVIILLVVLTPTILKRYWPIKKNIYTALIRLKSYMGIYIKTKTTGAMFVLGILNGLLPCGLVYIAIFGALASSTVLNGGLYMFLFGVGTVPLLSTVVFVGGFLKEVTRKKLVRFTPFFAAIMGVLFLLRGLGLGIPYVSPSTQVTIKTIDAKHSCY